MGVQLNVNLARSNNLCRSSMRSSAEKSWNEQRISGQTFYSQASIHTPAHKKVVTKNKNS